MAWAVHHVVPKMWGNGLSPILHHSLLHESHVAATVGSIKLLVLLLLLLISVNLLLLLKVSSSGTEVVEISMMHLVSSEILTLASSVTHAIVETRPSHILPTSVEITLHKLRIRSSVVWHAVSVPTVSILKVRPIGSTHHSWLVEAVKVTHHALLLLAHVVGKPRMLRTR